MITPPYLQPGDSIAIVSTARKITAEEIQPAIRIFESWGLKVITGANLHHQEHQFAGTDAERAADFNAMVHHPEVKAIVCARGGYGTIRIVDGIDWHFLQKHPKWIVGYSDITVLHSCAQEQFNLATLHATMPVNMGDTAPGVAESNGYLQAALRGEKLVYRLPAHPLNKPGTAKGLLTGGNLSVLYSLMGSQAQVDTRGKILFLEDLDEYLYHIDRMMMCLKRAGMLSNLAALVVGGMSKIHDNAVAFGRSAEEIIAAAVSEYDYPVYFNFPAGHIPHNFPLRMGSEAVITGSDLLM